MGCEWALHLVGSGHHGTILSRDLSRTMFDGSAIRVARWNPNDNKRMSQALEGCAIGGDSTILGLLNICFTCLDLEEARL